MCWSLLTGVRRVASQYCKTATWRRECRSPHDPGPTTFTPSVFFAYGRNPALPSVREHQRPRISLTHPGSPRHGDLVRVRCLPSFLEGPPFVEIIGGTEPATILHKSQRESCSSGMEGTMESPKPGDIRKCSQCGEERARYYRITIETISMADDDRSPERPPQPGDQYAWSCEACGFEDRVPS